MDVPGYQRASICIDHHITNQGLQRVKLCDADAGQPAELLSDFLDEGKKSAKCSAFTPESFMAAAPTYSKQQHHGRTIRVAGAMMAKGRQFLPH